MSLSGQEALATRWTRYQHEKRVPDAQMYAACCSPDRRRHFAEHFWADCGLAELQVLCRLRLCEYERKWSLGTQMKRVV